MVTVYERTFSPRAVLRFQVGLRVAVGGDADVSEPASDHGDIAPPAATR